MSISCEEEKENEEEKNIILSTSLERISV